MTGVETNEGNRLGIVMNRRVVVALARDRFFEKSSYRTAARDKRTENYVET